MIRNSGNGTSYREITLLIGDIGFRAAALAEISAWVGALLLNLIAYLRTINKFCCCFVIPSCSIIRHRVYNGGINHAKKFS